jgi:hypothetical protein
MRAAARRGNLRESSTYFDTMSERCREMAASAGNPDDQTYWLGLAQFGQACRAGRAITEQRSAKPHRLARRSGRGDLRCRPDDLRDHATHSIAVTDSASCQEGHLRSTELLAGNPKTRFRRCTGPVSIDRLRGPDCGNVADGPVETVTPLNEPHRRVAEVALPQKIAHSIAVIVSGLDDRECGRDGA